MSNGPLGTDAGLITKGMRKATDIAPKRKVPQCAGQVNVNKGKRSI